MLYTIKQLAVVLFFGFWIFRLARPIALVFCSEQDFALRRNTWFVLTTAGFLSPNFWIFTIVAVPVLLTAGRKDTNPSALYLLLLHVVPPIVISIPMIGISYLFDIDFYFILSVCLLLPLARRIRRSTNVNAGLGKLAATEYLLLAYGLLTAILFLHPQMPSGALYPTTFTDFLRRAFVFFFGTFVPFYAVARSGTSKASIVELLAMYTLGCAVMASVSIFEGIRHWLLFAEFGARWDVPFNTSNYITRGDSLRAMASSGHPLALGFLLAIAFGCWLYLGTRINSKITRAVVTILLWFGMFAAFSRGPWLGAIFMYFVFTTLRSDAAKHIFRAMGISITVAIVVVISPLRDKIVNVLPFFGGTVDTFNVTYRQRLLARCWEIIQDNFFFGDQDALLRMQDLRQGQGIIDIINAYVEVLLDNGFVGLSLFLAFILIAVMDAWTVSRRFRPIDVDMSLVGVVIVTCVLGTLVMLADGNLGTGPGRMFYALAAIATTYAYYGRACLRTAGTP